MGFYHQRAWRDRTRKQALHDAGWACQRCGISLAGKGREAHVHHRKPVKQARVLGLEPLNLLALCRTCHTIEHNSKAMRVALDGTPLDPRHPWHRGGLLKTSTPSPGERAPQFSARIRD
jgi:predicted HNH restriction endonuclease